MFELPIHAAFDINGNLFDNKAAKAQRRKNTEQLLNQALGQIV